MCIRTEGRPAPKPGADAASVLADIGMGAETARLVREHELAGRLHRVPEAPEFRLSAYLCFASAAGNEQLSLALDTIRQVAAAAEGGPEPG